MIDALAIQVETRRGLRYFVRYSRGGCQTAWSLAGGRMWNARRLYTPPADMVQIMARLKAEGRKPVVHFVTAKALASLIVSDIA